MTLRSWIWFVSGCALGMTVLESSSLALVQAVDTVNAEFVWQQGYTGSGVEIGVIDVHQADLGHPALSGSYLGGLNFAKGQGWIADHATAVAGAAVSQDPNRMGVAPGAGFWTAQTANRASRNPDSQAQPLAAETFAQGLGILNGNPAEVLTLSIGFLGSTTAADQWSLALDHVAATEGTTVVVAVGNDGPNPSSIPGPPGAAYNILSVGATGGTGAAWSDDYTQIAPYSSRGETSDGRSKPDIVAPGTFLELPTILPADGWTETSGTSFAAPLVAGGVALMIDLGDDIGLDTDPKVVKAVLMNSADKLPGWNNTPTSPLDPDFGAGQMNLEEAFHQYTAGEQEVGSVTGLGWDHAILSGATPNTYTIDTPVDAGASMTATLTWNRDVSTNTDNINTAIYSAAALENLELFLYDTTDLAIPVASSISLVDNVEHLSLTAPGSGSYLLEVREAGGAVLSPTSYSLAWDVEVADALPGDFLISGTVDGFDFLKWQRDTSIGSLADWEANYGTAATLASSTAVPEPTGFVLALAALSLVARRRS